MTHTALTDLSITMLPRGQPRLKRGPRPVDVRESNGKQGGCQSGRSSELRAAPVEVFDALVSASGIVAAAWALCAVLIGQTIDVTVLATMAIAVPVIGLLGYFAVSLGQALPSPNEPYVTFESAVLIFLVCTTDLTVALLAWVLGQLLVTSMTIVSLPVRLFNFGLLMTSGVVAIGVVRLLGGIDGPLSPTLSRTSPGRHAGSGLGVVAAHERDALLALRLAATTRRDADDPVGDSTTSSVERPARRDANSSPPPARGRPAEHAAACHLDEQLAPTPTERR